MKINKIQKSMFLKSLKWILQCLYHTSSMIDFQPFTLRAHFHSSFPLTAKIQRIPSPLTIQTLQKNLKKKFPLKIVSIPENSVAVLWQGFSSNTVAKIQIKVI